MSEDKIVLLIMALLPVVVFGYFYLRLSGFFERFKKK
jgi:hypothetical protein